MSANGYKLVRILLWSGAKWYLRQRLPPRRKIALAAGAGLSVFAGGAVISKRVAG